MVFEGQSSDTFETTFTITDPTADNSITFPDTSGEVSLLGQAIVTGEITDGTITNDDIAVAASIDESKLNLNNSTHAQNSDTGTTSTTLAIDTGSGGPLIKNNAGTLEVRDGGDTGYANLKGAQLQGSSIDITGDLTFGGVMYSGSGTVQLTDATGKIQGISSSYFADLSGANLTSLNASNLASGTVDNTLLDSDLQDLADGSLSGSKVGSGISGTNVTAGTVADARLESTVNRTDFVASQGYKYGTSKTVYSCTYLASPTLPLFTTTTADISGTSLDVTADTSSTARIVIGQAYVKSNVVTGNEPQIALWDWTHGAGAAGELKAISYAQLANQWFTSLVWVGMDSSQRVGYSVNTNGSNTTTYGFKVFGYCEPTT